MFIRLSRGRGWPVTYAGARAEQEIRRSPLTDSNRRPPPYHSGQECLDCPHTYLVVPGTPVNRTLLVDGRAFARSGRNAPTLLGSCTRSVSPRATQRAEMLPACRKGRA